MTEIAAGKIIVFFDGDCLMCQGTVRKLHALDQRDRLLFAPLAGKTARTLGLAETESIVVMEEGEQFLRSEAVRMILKEVLPLAAVGLGMVPREIRDRLYDLIAGRRKTISRLVGEKCGIPDERLRLKVLP